MRALVIEDEPALLQELESRLKGEGYAVDACADGEEGHFYGMEYPIDVAVVDLGLPKRPGLEVIRSWRASDRRFPILILTARDRWQDKVEGLEAGADDYLAKPFQVEELLARLRALVRRSAGFATDTLDIPPYQLDRKTQALTNDGEFIDVTAFEYRVIEYLMLHLGEVVSKSELVEHVYNEDMDPDSNVLEVLIGRLRKKLDPERIVNPIETLRGRGYRFRADLNAE